MRRICSRRAVRAPLLYFVYFFILFRSFSPFRGAGLSPRSWHGCRTSAQWSQVYYPGPQLQEFQSIYFTGLTTNGTQFKDFSRTIAQFFKDLWMKIQRLSRNPKVFPDILRSLLGHSRPCIERTSYNHISCIGKIIVKIRISVVTKYDYCYVLLKLLINSN